MLKPESGLAPFFFFLTRLFTFGYPESPAFQKAFVHIRFQVSFGSKLIEYRNQKCIALFSRIWRLPFMYHLVKGEHFAIRRNLIIVMDILNETDS